jgi:hypothetical protein
MRLGVFVGMAMLAVSAHAFAADDYVWTLDKQPDAITLTYMIPDSDAMSVSLSCTPSKKLGSYFDIETSEKLDGKKKAEVKLSVNGKSFKYKGDVTPNEEAGVPSFGADIPLKDKFWDELAKAKEFESVIGGVRDVQTLKGADIATFLKACRK